MKITYQPPLFVQNIFPQFVWHSEKEKILLTFDDGPNPHTTEKILQTLKDEKISALFFCVGDNVRRYSSLAKGIFEEQHALGNHAYHHQRVTRLSKKGLKDEIEMTNRIIEEVCGMHPNYFRPPHGRFTFHLAATLKEFKMKNVMWSLLTYDYKNDEKVVKFAIKNYLTKNAIVVFHDSDKSASLICDAIKYVADEAARKYFQFGTPEECLS